MDRRCLKWGNNESLNGGDGNKKVRGIKRHIVVDKNDFLVAVMVTVAVTTAAAAEEEEEEGIEVL